MIRLILAESRRFWSRRIVRFFPAIVALLILAGIVIAYFVITNGDTQTDFVWDIGGGPEATGVLEPLAALLPVMAFVIGASYVGADLKTGMIEQLLTWEPRRHRLVIARTISCFVGTAILAIALAVFMTALLYGLAAITGTTEGANAEFWGNVASATGRTGVSAGLFSLIGLGLTFAVNSSLGSIVGFLIYWFIIEGFLLSAFLPQVAVWLPVTNASSFATGRDVERVVGSVFSQEGPEMVSHHGYLAAGVILAAWVALSLAAGALIFERRDVA